MDENSRGPSLKRKILGPVGRTLAGLATLGGGLYAAQGYRDDARKETQTLQMYQLSEDRDLRNEAYHREKLNQANEDAAKLQQQLVEAAEQGDKAKIAHIKDDIVFDQELSQFRQNTIDANRKEVQELQPLKQMESEKIDANTTTANAWTIGGVGAAIAGIGSNFLRRKRKPGEIVRYTFSDSYYADMAMEAIGRELNSMGFNFDFKETEDYARRIYPICRGDTKQEVAVLEFHVAGPSYIELEVGTSPDRDYLKQVLDINAKANKGEKARAIFSR
jgi:hypothetical protein